MNGHKSSETRKLATYLNYMKYAYINKEIRKFIHKQSTRRKTLKNYKSYHS